jgi:pimeloyl-ACP methyl ester carboxylesterase
MRNLSIALALLLVNLGATTAGGAATIQFEPYLLAGPEGMQVAAELGTLQVPEVRGRAGSRSIPLRFVRLRATTAEPGPPIVYLAGGPGGSAVGNARGPRFAFFNRLREAGDVLLLEQRGAGLSNTLPSCEARPVDPARPLDRANFVDSARRELARCIAWWRDQGVGVEGYNSDESAADLDDLRRALGVEQLNLVGLSYGTHLGMVALKRRLPVGRVVFAGLEGLDQTVKQPAHFDAFFARVAAAVRADPEAARAYPDLLATMRRVHDRLDREPARVTVRDGEGRPVEIRLGAFAVQMLTGFLWISDPERIAGLPALYARMDGGDFQSAGETIYRGLMAFFGRLDGMPQLMDLASGISEARLGAVAAQAPAALLGDAGNFPMPHARDVAPELALGDGFRAALDTPVPALLVMGTMDGRTPVESQRELLPQFRNATVLTAVNGGHNIFEQSEEVQRAIVAFLRDGTVDRDRIELPPVRFRVEARPPDRQD